MDGGGDGEVVGQKSDVLGSEIVAGSVIVEYQARAEQRYEVRI